MGEMKKSKYDLFYDYVARYVYNQCPRYNDTQIDNLSEKIVKKFLEKGYSYKLLCNGVYSEEIDSEIHINNMRLNSIKGNNSSKLKYIPRKKFFSKAMICLLILVSLMAAASSVTRAINNIDYMAYYSKYDSYNYPSINTIYNENYDDTCRAVIRAYDSLNDYENENYCHLGFYKAYDSIRENRLAIMDNMLLRVQCSLAYTGKCPSFYEEIKDCNNYLRYVYDRLIAMGCDERDDLSKFLLAIEKYEKLQANGVGIPYDSLDKECQEDLEKYMKLYRNKSEECLINFGKEMSENKKAKK